MTAEPENLTIQMLKTIRREQDEHRSLLLGLIDQGRRVERRMSEMRDDLELMIKSELMGRLTHFEIRMDEKIEHAFEQKTSPTP